MPSQGAACCGAALECGDDLSRSRSDRDVSASEIIKDLAERLERQVIIDELSKIKSMEELEEYIEKLRAKNE